MSVESSLICCWFVVYSWQLFQGDRLTAVQLFPGTLVLLVQLVLWYFLVSLSINLTILLVHLKSIIFTQQSRFAIPRVVHFGYIVDVRIF
jgi:hypothetical protein